MLLLTAVLTTFAQESKLPILNGAAAELLKPVYTIDAENHCVKGEAHVEIEYKAIGGNPLSAKMVLGHELLKESVEAAAMKTQMQVVRHADAKAIFKGILIYNFIAPKNILCIDTKKVLNDRVKQFPDKKIGPQIANGHLRLPEKEIEVNVAIVVDEVGKVIYAKADKSAPILLKMYGPVFARQAEFSPTNGGSRVRVLGFLLIRFKPDGSVTLPQMPMH